MSYQGIGVGAGRAFGVTLSIPAPIAEPADQSREATFFSRQDDEDALTVATDAVAGRLRRSAAEAKVRPRAPWRPQR